MTRAPILAVALLLGVAGCGADDGGGASRADFVQRADAVCERWDARIDQAKGEQLGTSIAGLLDELERLARPERDHDEVEALVASGRADLAALERGNEPSAEPFAEFRRRASALGLYACAASTRD